MLRFGHFLSSAAAAFAAVSYLTFCAGIFAARSARSPMSDALPSLSRGNNSRSAVCRQVALENRFAQHARPTVDGTNIVVISSVRDILDDKVSSSSLLETR